MPCQGTSKNGGPQVDDHLRKHHLRALGRLHETLFPSNLDRGEGTCFELAVDLLIPRPS